MSLLDFDTAKAKLILKTSQGFPTQYESSKAQVQAGSVSPSRAGHATASHLRGATTTQFKTKFCSLDQMAEALALLLNTPLGQAAVGRLQPGSREKVATDLDRTFEIEATIDGIGAVKFNRHDLAMASINRTSCVAILECRARAGDMHLHVQTFYPKLDGVQMQRLLDAKTAPR